MLPQRILKLVTPMLAVGLALALTTGAAGAQEFISYVPWADASIGIQAEVPAGWRVEASVADAGAGAAPFVLAFSPDDSAVVLAGTPPAGLFLHAAPALGLFEGQVVDFDADARVTVRTYQEPAAYLQHYLSTDLLATACGNGLTILDGGAVDTGDASRSAGELSVRCDYTGGQAFGYFYLDIARLDAGSAGFVWTPATVYGYLAEPAWEDQAAEALIHLAQTFAAGSAAPPAQPYVDAGPDYAAAPVEQGQPPADSGTTDYTQAAWDLYNQQQTTAMLSDMLAAQHQTNMMIINNIGGGDYEWQWTWTYGD